MKLIDNITYSRILAMTLVVAAMACAVEDEYIPGDPRPAGAPYTTTTNTRIVNASPGAKAGTNPPPTVQFAFNNILQLTNQSQPQSETNQPVELTYLGGTPYRGIRATAAAQVKYFNKGDNKLLGSLQANYLVGTSYTTFLIDTVTRAAGMRVLQFSDNLAAPPAGNAKVRFIHLSPNAPRVVVTNPNNSDAVVFSARTYAQTGAAIQNYTNLPAGTYTLDVRNDVAVGKPVVLTLEDVVFDAGKIYTVFARGLVGGAAGQELGASIIVHN